MSDVVNINPARFCAFCCSNSCYCSKDSLLRQLAEALPAIKERNEQITSLRESLKLAVEGLRHSISCEVIRALMIRKNKVFICECGMDKTLAKIKAKQGD